MEGASLPIKSSQTAEQPKVMYHLEKAGKIVENTSEAFNGFYL